MSLPRTVSEILASNNGVTLKSWYDLHICYHSQTVIRTTATDRQRLEALITPVIRFGLCGADVSSLAELVDSADDALFQRILANRLSI